jgi:hypothetical protein
MRRLFLLFALAPLAAAAQPAGWEPLPARFESTGGGGWMIEGYEPVLVGDRCVTDFTAVSPAGERFRNAAAFVAVPQEGGVICREGRFAAKDGSGSGTTPLVLFIRADGQRFRAP